MAVKDVHLGGHPPEGSAQAGAAPEESAIPMPNLVLLEGTGPGSEVDLVNRFSYHPPKSSQGHQERYASIRSRALGLAVFIRVVTPPTREQSLALTKLEEAVMWANAAIARGE